MTFHKYISYGLGVISRTQISSLHDFRQVSWTGCCGVCVCVGGGGGAGGCGAGIKKKARVVAFVRDILSQYDLAICSFVNIFNTV